MPPLKQDGIRDQSRVPLPDASEQDSAGGHIASLLAENHELRAELEQLRSERAHWMDLQRRMMEVLGSSAPEKMVHDLRNVLNERALLKALVDEL